MGLVRNLSADEILSQMIHGVRVARESGLPPIGNVVSAFLKTCSKARNFNVPIVTLG
jgi:hypothetical protein